ncbi:hypothetical protein F4810DRAFT_529846 [Camillea tinctor]|nr:hypothetical protein F4810DRAFT_529846 [Camillea tinctor]
MDINYASWAAVLLLLSSFFFFEAGEGISFPSKENIGTNGIRNRVSRGTKANVDVGSGHGLFARLPIQPPTLSECDNILDSRRIYIFLQSNDRHRGLRFAAHVNGIK